MGADTASVHERRARRGTWAPTRLRDTEAPERTADPIATPPLRGTRHPLRAAVRSLRSASRSCERGRRLAAPVRPSSRFASLAEGPALLTEDPAPLARSPAALRRHRGPFITAPSGCPDDRPGRPLATRGSIHEIRGPPPGYPRPVHGPPPAGRANGGGPDGDPGPAVDGPGRSQATRRRNPQMGQAAMPLCGSRRRLVGQPLVPQYKRGSEIWRRRRRRASAPWAARRRGAAGRRADASVDMSSVGPFLPARGIVRDPAVR
jgi:hypothetical protein